MNQSLKMAGVATLGAGVGLVIGYKIAEKRLGDRFERRLEEETADMKEFYTSVKQKYDSPEEAAAALIPKTESTVEDPRVKTQKIQYNKIVKEQKYVGDGDGDDGLEEFKEGCEIEEVVHKNVFESTRVEGEPYIINQDDFMANETGYEQATLTLYTKGGVLTDQRDDVIDNADDVVGKLSVSNFGEGSSDPNVVHVRNEKLEMEFEVVKSERSFEEDVLGKDDVDQRDRRLGR